MWISRPRPRSRSHRSRQAAGIIFLSGCVPNCTTSFPWEVIKAEDVQEGLRPGGGLLRIPPFCPANQRSGCPDAVPVSYFSPPFYRPCRADLIAVPAVQAVRLLDQNRLARDVDAFQIVDCLHGNGFSFLPLPYPRLTACTPAAGCRRSPRSLHGRPSGRIPRRSGWLPRRTVP